jgi:predicted ATP-grasp superfamily ATP-dependent carboligase
MTLLAVAGLSARAMAEAAARDGFGVVALDLFGDIDTCAVASRWFGIGEPAGLRIDGDRLLAALALLARQGEVAGWVAGSGFEGRPGLLARGAELLPLIGIAPAALARLRDPAQFFGFLAESDVDHPPVRLAPDAGDGAWLLKDLHGSGGWHIRRTLPGEPVALPTGHYLQREMAGQSLSVTFVAAGGDVRLLGANLQIVRALGDRPFVYCGVVGPVPVAAAVMQRLRTIVRTLASGLALRGLGSLDFLLDGGQVLVLEVNARPPASIDLYPAWQPMAAHLRACRQPGELPEPPADGGPVRGRQIVFARQPAHCDAALAGHLAARPHVHDLPAAGQHFAAGAPLCSVGATGRSATEVLERLHERHDALLASLEAVS